MNVVAPCAGVWGRRADAGHVAASLKDVVRDHCVRRAESASSPAHLIMQAVIHESIENDDIIVRSIMAGQRIAVINIAIAIAHVHGNRIGFEIVGKDLVAVSENPHALCIAHVIPIIKAIVSVSLADLPADAIQHRIVAVGVARRFVGDHFIFAFATHEQVVFAEAIAGRKTQPAQSPANRFRAIAARTGEIMEVVMMHPKPPRDLAARAGNVQHLTESRLVPQLIIIDLGVVPVDVDVRNLVRGWNAEFDRIAREPAMTGAAGDAQRIGVSELESLNGDVSRRTVQIETMRTPNFDSADGLCLDGDRIGRSADLRHSDRSRRRIDAVADDNRVSRDRAVDPRVQFRNRRDLISARRRAPGDGKKT